MTEKSDRSEPPSPAAVKPSGAKRAAGTSSRAARRLPNTLVELYSDSRARPVELLRYLEQRDLYMTSEEDQRSAQLLVGTHDVDLNKTRLLAQDVANSYEGRFVAAFHEFLVRCVESDLRGLRSWPPGDADGALLVLRELLAAQRASLAKKDPGRRAVNLVLTVQALMSSRFGLAAWDTVPLLAEAFKPASHRPKRSPVALGHPAVNGPVLRFWLDALGPWIERATGDAGRARRAEIAEQTLLARVADLETQVFELTQRSDTLAADLQSTAAELRSTRLARQVESSQLRGSLAAFLTDDLSAQLRSAEEGLSLTPPRVAHALERIDDLHHAIKEKARWLRSSV